MRFMLQISAIVPSLVFDECWKQLRLARYRIPDEHVMDMYVDPTEGHDDFLMSVALCSEALRDLLPPPVESLVVRPRRLYCDDGRF